MLGKLPRVTGIIAETAAATVAALREGTVSLNEASGVFSLESARDGVSAQPAASPAAPPEACRSSPPLQLPMPAKPPAAPAPPTPMTPDGKSLASKPYSYKAAGRIPIPNA